MDRSRISRLQAALRDAGLDALILRLPENLVMALGVWPMNGLSYGLFTADGGPLGLVAPSCEDEEMDGCWAGEVRFFVWPRLAGDDPRTAIGQTIGDWAKRFKLSRARIGYEGRFRVCRAAPQRGRSDRPLRRIVGVVEIAAAAGHLCDATRSCTNNVP